MKQQQQIPSHNLRGPSIGKPALIPLNNRYATQSPQQQQHHQHQQKHQQSNSVTTTPTGSHHGMRTVASTPIFASVDPVCGCHKCQVRYLLFKVYYSYLTSFKC